MRGPDRRVVLLGAAATASVTFVPQIPEAASPSQATLIRRGDRLFIPARLNNIAVEGLLDSAAEATLLAPSLAARLRLTTGSGVDAHGSGASTVTAQLIKHVEIAAAGVKVPDATVAVVNLDDVSLRLTGRPIELVIGREIFDTARLDVDIAAGTIRRTPKNAIPRGVRLPLLDDRGLMLMPISIEGHPTVQAEFDLGNGTGVIVSRRCATRLGLFDGRPVTSSQGGGLGGAKPREGLNVRTLSVAGETLRNVHVDIDDAVDAHDANIGVGVLQHFRITADFQHHQIWLQAL